MRRRRVIIFGGDRELLNMMTYYFVIRGEYEVLSYQEPAICPIWADDADCTNISPCADIIIADLVMPKMDGINLFMAQTQRGCKISLNNKALISRNFDNNKMKDIMESGCVFFEGPIDFHKLTAWLHNREQQMELSRPLNIKRKEKRYMIDEDIACIVQPNNKFLRGFGVNKSHSGLCLKTKTPLRQEQTVTVHSEHSYISRTASVRWAVKMENGLYMMGLQYTQS